MNKVILITGTSTGLGISIAVGAARAGHTVYATMRNLDRRAALDDAAKTAGVVLNMLQLDVQNTASVDAAVATVIADHGRIDTLINNAGLGFVRSTEQATESDIQNIMDINFMGVVRCTKAVIGHMRVARAGHVINITSVGGLIGQPFNEIYCAAKFAVEGYTESMASYITPSFGINFTAIEPGGIRTDFVDNVMKHVGATGGMLDDEYLPILQKYIGGSQARQDEGAYQTADEVADVVIGVIDAPTPPIRIRTSKWSEDLCHWKTQIDPDGTKQQASIVAQFLG